MKLIKKQITTTIKLNNSERLLDIGEHLSKEINNFIMQTKKVESNEIVANIEMRALNDIRVEYDVDKVTRPLIRYKEILMKLDKEIEEFIEEVKNIKFNKEVPQDPDQGQLILKDRKEWIILPILSESALEEIIELHESTGESFICEDGQIVWIE